SQWGHDFRPEYAALGEVKRRLGVPAIALTATADKATRADILNQLFESEPKIFVHGFDRPNLRLAIQPKDNARQQLLRLLDRQRGQSGVIYCPSR
ncbi:ATP-dependent DNA helicase RecQ, partial [Acinetobacter baumannii]